MRCRFVLAGVLTFFLSALLAISAECRAEENYSAARQSMVNLIERRGVKDKEVVKVMREVPRHLFMPERVRDYAYEDGPVPIGHGQTISQPYIVAFMTEALALEPGNKVLEIGTGSGYQAAVLAKLAHSVYTIEIVEPLGKSAEATLIKLGFKNVKVKIGDGYKGWPEFAPFDRIIVTAAPPEIPKALVEQLADGGRMIVPVGVEEQELILLTKKNGKVIEEAKLPVRFVPMVKGASSD